MGFWSKVKKKGSDFKDGAGRLLSGDVSKEEFVGNYERRLRQATPSVIEDYQVGLLRATTGTTGKSTPTTQQVMKQRALKANLKLLRDRSGDQSIGTVGRYTSSRNPTTREAYDKRIGPAVRALPDAATEALEKATEALAEAAAGIGEGASKGLLKGAGPYLLVAGAGVVGVLVVKEKVL